VEVLENTGFSEPLFGEEWKRVRARASEFDSALEAARI